jgi:hypothetical protein
MRIVVDRYCMECFAPSAGDYCERHRPAGVRLCRFCGERLATIRHERGLACARCVNTGRVYG